MSEHVFFQTITQFKILVRLQVLKRVARTIMLVQNLFLSR